MALKVGRMVQYPNGAAVPTVQFGGARATAQASSTAQVALPAGSRVIAIRATEPVWIRFGDTGMAPADASDSSMLFPSGEAIVLVPLNDVAPYAYFRVLRAGTADGYVQIEQIAHTNS